jgi:hypothetical protein
MMDKTDSKNPLKKSYSADSDILITTLENYCELLTKLIDEKKDGPVTSQTKRPTIQPNQLH